MAGIGIKLNKFFDKGTVTGYLAGSGYSVVTTIAPMLLVIADILAMQKILGYSDAAYGSRQLFQATILYIFVFALLASAPLNAVLSRYVSDVIFNETYSDIMAAFHLGLWISMAIDAIIINPIVIARSMEYVISILNLFTNIYEIPNVIAIPIK